MALALEHLHMCGIVYRCTLPETLLLDEDGRLQLTDFRFSKVLDGRTYTLCGAPEYLVGPHRYCSQRHRMALNSKIESSNVCR